MLNDDTRIVRAFSRDKLLGETGLFQTSALYLARATMQSDELEYWPTHATLEKYRQHDLEKGQDWVTPMLLCFERGVIASSTFLTCWSKTLDPSSEALSSYGAAALVETTVGRLRSIDHEFAQFEVEEVKYVTEDYVPPEQDGADMKVRAFLKRDEFSWENEVRGVGTLGIPGGLVSDIIEQIPSNFFVTFDPKAFVCRIRLVNDDAEVEAAAESFAGEHQIELYRDRS